MCDSASFDGNRVEVCRIGDLKPGDHFRTPEGRTWLVTAHQQPNSEHQFCACIEDGRMDAIPDGVRLGRDRRGRLYASRYLNRPQAVVADQPIIASPQE